MTLRPAPTREGSVDLLSNCGFLEELNFGQGKSQADDRQD
jgi:hypothetical protein